MSEKDRISALTSSAKAGNSEAFEELYSAYESRIYFFCFHLLNDEQDAVEVTRDTFVHAWKQIKSMPSNQTFFQWICGNAFCFCQMKYRNRRGEEFSVGDGDGNDAFYDMMMKSKAPAQEPIVRRSDLNTVSDQLDLMPNSERICLLLHDYAGFSIIQIASIAECPEDAAKCHVYNARTAIRDALDSRNPESGAALFPFIPRLLKTAGRNCKVPEAVAAGVRDVLAGRVEESEYISSLSDFQDGAPQKDRGKLITIICAVLGVLVIIGGSYLVWWFANGVSDIDASIPEVSQESAPNESSLPAESIPAESSISSESSEPVSESSDESPAESSLEESLPAESSLEEPSTAPTESSTEPVQTGTTTDPLRMRSEPDTTKDNILLTIPAGAQVTIIGSTSDAGGTVWYQVRYGNMTGYCSSDYIRLS